MNSKRTLGRAIIFSVTLSFLAFNLATPVATENSFTATVGATNPPQQVETAKRVSPRRRARTYDVVHYIIRTKFDVPNKTVIGEVDVTFKPLSNGFNTFELDAAKMTIEQVSLSSGKVLRSVTRADTLLISLDHTYNSSDSITVKIKYRTRPQRGLYFISQAREDGFQRPSHIWTQGEPQDNHYWFPCYDFPDDKATSEQYITTGGNQLAIANGLLAETTANPNGTRTFHWQMNQPHSSYLISLIVGDYAKLSDTYEHVALEYYTYRGTEEPALRAFNVTPKIIRWFTDALEFDFPYDRYAQTVVGNFIFGGMENITATTFADSEIVFDEGNGSDSDTINLVSHELAHSWFGDLVTCKDWSHLWLNEGFATFMEAAYREGRNGREAYLFELQSDAQAYFREDPSHKRHPLVNPNYPLSMELFDETTYKKGAFVVHMLRETVGNDVFWKSLNVYLKEYKYRNVDSRDLQRVFEKVSGQSLEWFFDQWVYKAGYPELTVRSQYSTMTRRLTLNITQTQKADYITPAVFRLAFDIEIVTPAGARTEHIDFNRRTQDFTFQLDDRPQSITFDKRASILKKLTIAPSRTVASITIRDGADQSGAINRIDIQDAQSIGPILYPLTPQVSISNLASRLSS